MTLIELKKMNLLSKKEGNPVKSKLLQTFIGEVETISKKDTKRSESEIIVATAKKMILGNKEILKQKDLPELEEENSILETFLPTELTVEEMKTIISENNLTNIKDGMGFFKANYPQQYDGKTLSELLRNL